MICLMHAGGGLCNKLNLTSSKRGTDTDGAVVIYYVFIVGYLSRGCECFVKPARCLALSNNLFVYGFILWIYAHTKRKTDRFVMKGRDWVLRPPPTPPTALNIL